MRSLLGITAKALAALVAVVLVVAVSVGYYLVQRPLPMVNGSEMVTGLKSPVEIVRDQWGVPHIFADNPEVMI